MLLPSANSSGELTGESGLLWKQRVTWEWELWPQRRGCYQMGPVELSAGDLLGFFQRKKEVLPQGEIIVFPRLIPLKDFSFPREEFFGTQGARSPLQDPVYPLRHVTTFTAARHGLFTGKQVPATTGCRRRFLNPQRIIKACW